MYAHVIEENKKKTLCMLICCACEHKTTLPGTPKDKGTEVWDTQRSTRSRSKRSLQASPSPLVRDDETMESQHADFHRICVRFWHCRFRQPRQEDHERNIIHKDAIDYAIANGGTRLLVICKTCDSKTLCGTPVQKGTIDTITPPTPPETTNCSLPVRTDTFLSASWSTQVCGSIMHTCQSHVVSWLALHEEGFWDWWAPVE